MKFVHRQKITVGQLHIMEELLQDKCCRIIAIEIYYRETNRYRLKLVAVEFLLKMTIRVAVRNYR
jgi:hypothetical protein